MSSIAVYRTGKTERLLESCSSGPCDCRLTVQMLSGRAEHSQIYILKFEMETFNDLLFGAQAPIQELPSPFSSPSFLCHDRLRMRNA